MLRRLDSTDELIGHHAVERDLGEGERQRVLDNEVQKEQTLNRDWWWLSRLSL